MREKIAEAMVDEFEKMGYLGLASKAVQSAAGKAMTKAVSPKQGLIKRIIKNPSVRSAAGSVGTGLAFTAPSMIMQRQPKSQEPVTGGLR